jgi:hypothetical protein
MLVVVPGFKGDPLLLGISVMITPLYVRHKGDFLPPSLRDFSKKSSPSIRENNIPPYVRNIFREIDP